MQKGINVVAIVERKHIKFLLGENFQERNQEDILMLKMKKENY